jgi:hypothetical protein
VTGQQEAEGVCTDGEAEDGEVDLLLLMGRGDDFGEICDGLAPREPGETNAEARDGAS